MGGVFVNNFKLSFLGVRRKGREDDKWAKVDQAMEENPQQRVGAGLTLRDGYPSCYPRHFAPQFILARKGE